MRRISYSRKFRKPVVLRAKVKQKLLNKLLKVVKVFLIFVIIVTGVFFVGKTVHEFLYSDTFEIKQIEIEGLESIPEDKFLKALSDVGLKVGGNLIETYFIKVEKKIKYFLPVVKSVRIKRYFPNRIKFIVVEREPIATVKVVGEVESTQVGDGVVGEIMAIDEENVCFATDRDLTCLPKIVISSDVSSASSSTLPAVKLLKAIQGRDNKLYLSVLKSYNIKGELILLLRSNTKIFWGEYNSGFVDAQIGFLNKVLLDAENRFGGGFKNINYIDLKLFNEGRIIVNPVAGWRRTKWQDKRLCVAWM
ncbi:MAG: FtsQ-type POTRA domain-containing protein [Elusimicrobiota bacterium]|nr:FtsQ-type POTRA domain-containing protein [Elusimicrobiota bacterium]